MRLRISPYLSVFVWEGWGGAACLLLLVLVLFPLFAQPDTRPRGLLVDGDNRPIASGEVRFRDARTGAVKGRYVSDNRGMFRFERRHLEGHRCSADLVPEGFVPLLHRHSTGGVCVDVFSPAAEHVYRFTDESGHSMANLPVEIGFTRGVSRSVGRFVTSAAGEVRIPEQPAALPMRSVIVGAGLGRRSRVLSREWRNGEVRFQVAVQMPVSHRK